MDADKHRWGSFGRKAKSPVPMGVVILLFLALLILVAGCGLRASVKHEETVKSGVAVIPSVGQLIKLYPNFPKRHMITHFGFEESKPAPWNTVVYIHERYTLIFKVDVEVDYNRNSIKSVVGTSEFFLYETASISRDGTQTIGEQWRFGTNEWNKVFAGNGDFTRIGIVLKTNAPIPGWDRFVVGKQ